MNEQMRLKLSLSGPELINALHKLTQLEPFEHELPTSLEVDFKKRKITPDWLEQWSPSCQKMLMAFWGSDYSYFLTYRPNIIVQAAFNFQRDAQSVLSLLTSLPFELVSFATL